MDIKRLFGQARRAWSRLALGAALAVSVVLAGAAHGQGTSGTLPNPISTQELNEYAKWLGLSDQQRQAAEKVHDGYKQEFRALRDGDIASFMNDMRALQGAGMPRRKETEAFMKKMDDLNEKIASVDNRLFDGLLPVLTDEQGALLPRIRMARERARYEDQQMMTGMFGQRPTDLSLIFRALDLPADVYGPADAVMASYETRLTSELGKLHGSVSRMVLDMLDIMEKQGFSEETMKDPEGAQKAMEAMQAAMREITKKGRERLEEISGLNQRTYKSVHGMLPPEAAREFRQKYFERAYPEAGFSQGNETEFAHALKMPELSDEQKQGIAAARDETLKKLDAVMDETAAIIDDFRKNSSPMDFTANDWQSHWKKISEMQAKAAEARQAGSKALADLLGPDLAGKLQIRVAESAQKEAAQVAGGQVEVTQSIDGAVVASSMVIDGDGSKVDEDDVHEWSGDQVLPTRISERDIKEYAAVLRLNDDQRTVLQTMHKDYLEKFQAVADAEVAAVTKAAQAMWHYDQATQISTGPTAQQIEDIYRLRRKALEAIAKSDGAFFDDVETALVEPAQAPLMKRVRLARERDVCSQGGRQLSYMYSGESAEASIDLARFVRRAKLDDAAQAAADPVLAAYEEKATPLFRSVFDAGLDMQKAQDTWSAEVTKAQADGGQGNAMAMGMKYQEMMAAVGKKIAEAATEVSKLNRETIESLLAALDADASYKVRSAYNRKAYPTVYNDDQSVDRQLTYALRLDALTEEQQRALNDLAAEYRPAYNGFCDQMVQATAAGDGANRFMGFDAEAWKKYQERQDAIEKIRYDRNELNQRANSRLRSTLTPEQIAKIGGLPEPPKERRGGMYGFD